MKRSLVIAFLAQARVTRVSREHCARGLSRPMAPGAAFRVAPAYSRIGNAMLTPIHPNEAGNTARR